MASLDRMPTELLILIVQSVGREYLRKHLDFLTLNRRLFQIAQEMLFEDVCLSALQLSQLLASPESARTPFKRNVKRLRINIDLAAETVSGKLIKEPWGAASLCARECDVVYTELKIRLDHNLMDLAGILSDCKKLEVFHIQARLRTPEYGWRFFSRQVIKDSTFATVMSSLPKPSLRVLNIEIDQPMLIMCNGYRSGDDPHLCPIIGTYLPGLRELRLQLPSICPETLTPSASGMNPNRLEIVEVSYTSMVLSRGETHAYYSIYCDHESDGLPMEPQTALHAASQLLATRSPNIRSLILFANHQEKSSTWAGQIRRIDVLTGELLYFPATDGSS